MTTIKIIIAILSALVTILLVVAVFVAREYAVERAVVINKPTQEVFDYVRYMKNQDRYNKWVMVDPAMKKEFSGIDGTPGFVYTWDGDKAGKGEQKITSIIEGERIEMELLFIKPFEGVAVAHMQTEALTHHQTKLSWGMKGRSKYPMNIMNLFMDSMLGKDLEASLTTLRNLLER